LAIFVTYMLLAWTPRYGMVRCREYSNQLLYVNATLTDL